MSTNQETLQRVRGIVSDLFLVPEEEIDESSSPKTIPAWDSMGQLNLILELEQAFDIELTNERVRQMGTVGSIADMVDAAPIAA